MAAESDTILITGGSGYISSFTILHLLKKGYTSIRTTVRTVEKQNSLIAALKGGGVSDDLLKYLSFFVADLLNDAGWDEALKGVKYVLHIASPLYLSPSEANLFIPTAEEGTLRVLKKAKIAGVKRVVQTSSMVTIGRSKNEPTGRRLNEEDWSELEFLKDPYSQSKLLAEKTSWEYIQGEGKGLELVVILPSLVLGPVLSDDYTNTINVIKNIVEGLPPPFNPGTISLSDVRDLAAIHVKAIEVEAAAGHRFIASQNEGTNLVEISLYLKEKLPAKYSTTVALVTDTIPVSRVGCIDKAKAILGYQPHTWQESVMDTATSLIEHGLVGERK